jgi:photosystem II stability/assembly factor-like uncharacterized protein
MKIIKVYKTLSAFLFYITLIFIIAGINFSDSRSSGWFIQTLPINDEYLDLFFLDSLNGWMVSKGYPGTSDTGYIIHTSNGGYNWVVQKAEPQLFRKVQFLNTNNGYVVGGNTLATIQKTTNGGLNWIDITGSMSNKFGINDMSFINKDTGWICINDLFDGGVYKTVNGGLNWVLQKYDGRAYLMQFINKDTGWYCSDESKLYRTVNGGDNWSLQYSILTSSISDLFFLNGSKGWIYADYKKYTTDGGFTWTNSQGSSGGYDIKFLNENTGYAGTYSSPPKINKSIDGGIHWGYQTTPYLSANLVSILKNDSLNAWASILMHTTDSGGQIIFSGINQIGTNVPDDFKLYQNFPNPFNSMTNIKYSLKNSEFRIQNSELKIVVYNLIGKEIGILVNGKKSPGEYVVKFDGSNLPSGIYFYTLFADGVRIDSKKMALIK